MNPVSGVESLATLVRHAARAPARAKTGLAGWRPPHGTAFTTNRASVPEWRSHTSKIGARWVGRPPLSLTTKVRNEARRKAMTAPLYTVDEVASRLHKSRRW